MYGFYPPKVRTIPHWRQKPCILTTTAILKLCVRLVRSLAMTVFSAVSAELYKRQTTLRNRTRLQQNSCREATCQQGGLELNMCKNCGSYYTESTSMTDHHYQTSVVPSTCTMNGYTEHKCIDCGYKYITDLTSLAKHDYREKVTAPTCTTRGFTTYSCANCDDVYINDYTDALGHEWDNGHTVTSSTCDSEGVMEYDCKHCDEKMIQAISATGHTPDAAATCTEPQTCETWRSNSRIADRTSLFRNGNRADLYGYGIYDFHL